MARTSLITTAAVGVLLLTGCSQQMSVSDAATYYLDSICPTNAALDHFDTQANLNDPAAIAAAAGEVRDAASRTASRLDSDSARWPTNVVKDVKLIRDAYFTWTSQYSELSRMTTLTEMSSVNILQQPDAQTAGQRVRARLGLTSDTVASCVGHSH